MSVTGRGQLLLVEAQLHFDLLFDKSNEANIAVILPAIKTKIENIRLSTQYVTTYVWFLD
jgi:hypothetical protein